MWFWFALGSAIFAALTSILAKVGIKGVESNLATAIRTMVVVVMAWGMVFITNSASQFPKPAHPLSQDFGLKHLSAHREQSDSFRYSFAHLHNS